MSSTKRKKGGLLKGEAVYEVDNKSRVFCSYCGRDFLVTCVGTHMNTQCKNGMVAMGKNPVAVEQQRKEVRNKRNKEKSKIYENRLKINKTIWEREYNKMKPVKAFDSKFIKVKSWNPFFLKESEVKKDEEMQVLFDKLLQGKWKENAKKVKHYFEVNQTRQRLRDWKQMKLLARQLLGPKLQFILHSDKMKE